MTSHGIASAALLIAPCAAGGTAHAGGAEPVTRCGWFDHPTPGNAWLLDRDGGWVIGMPPAPCRSPAAARTAR